MPLDFSKWGQKLPPKKYVNFLPCPNVMWGLWGSCLGLQSWVSRSARGNPQLIGGRYGMGVGELWLGCGWVVAELCCYMFDTLHKKYTIHLAIFPMGMQLKVLLTNIRWRDLCRFFECHSEFAALTNHIIVNSLRCVCQPVSLSGKGCMQMLLGKFLKPVPLNQHLIYLVDGILWLI